jgi:hypothetical protein
MCGEFSLIGQTEPIGKRRPSNSRGDDHLVGTEARNTVMKKERAQEAGKTVNAGYLAPASWLSRMA